MYKKLVFILVLLSTIGFGVLGSYKDSYKQEDPIQINVYEYGDEIITESYYAY